MTCEDSSGVNFRANCVENLVFADNFIRGIIVQQCESAATDSGTFSRESNANGNHVESGSCGRATTSSRQGGEHFYEDRSNQKHQINEH